MGSNNFSNQHIDEIKQYIINNPEKYKYEGNHGYIYVFNDKFLGNIKVKFRKNNDKKNFLEFLSEILNLQKLHIFLVY